MSDDQFQREVLTQLGSLNGKFDEFKESVNTKVADLQETINGNGHPGLKADVATLKTQMSEVRGADESAGRANRAAVASVTALLVGIGGWIAQMLGITAKP
jgi:hypothetical protein